MSTSTGQASTASVREPRFSTLQIALVLIALAGLAVLAGMALEHLSAFASLSDHPVNGRCGSCN